MIRLSALLRTIADRLDSPQNIAQREAQSRHDIGRALERLANRATR